MEISKVAIGSIVIGLAILLGMWYFIFYQPVQPDVVKSLITGAIVTIQGGVVLLGLILLIVGILMLII